MKIKSTIQTIVFILAVTAFLVTPVYAQGTTPQDLAPVTTIFAILTAAFNALVQSVGVGSGLSFLNQLGKICFPKYFPNDSSAKWRLAAIFVLTLLIVFGPQIFPQFAGYLTVLKLDQLGRDFAEFGSLLIPLFIVGSKYSSEWFYRLALRGGFLGKSYSA